MYCMQEPSPIRSGPLSSLSSEDSASSLTRRVSESSEWRWFWSLHSPPTSAAQILKESSEDSPPSIFFLGSSGLYATILPTAAVVGARSYDWDPMYDLKGQILSIKSSNFSRISSLLIGYIYNSFVLLNTLFVTKKISKHLTNLNMR